MTDPRGTAEYRAARARVYGLPCWRCGGRGTTADHVPALAEHAHVIGSGCCEVLPACRRCNFGAGRRIAARTARTGRPSRVW